MRSVPPAGGALDPPPLHSPPLVDEPMDQAPSLQQQQAPKSFKEAIGGSSSSTSVEIDTEVLAQEGDIASTMTERGPVVVLSDQYRARVHKQWDNTVIVKLWGRLVGYRMLCNHLPRLWGLKGSFRAIDLDHNYFFVKLSDESDYLRALTGGPWVIMDHYLTVEPWQPNFDPAGHRVTSVVAWVQIPGLSCELYQRDILRAVCDQIGRMVRVDYSTQKTERGKFANVAMELDLSKPLQTEACVEGKWYFIKYESLPQVPNGGQPSESGPVNEIPAGASTPATSSKYGEWILVPPRSRPGAKKTMQGQKDQRDNAPQMVTGSRFDALANSSKTGRTTHSRSDAGAGSVLLKDSSRGMPRVAKGGVAKAPGTSVNPSNGKGKGTGQMGVFSGAMDIMETSAAKRTRGAQGYTISGETLMDSALATSRRVTKAKSKASASKRNEQGGSNKWDAVLIKDVPIPLPFQVPTTVPPAVVQESVEALLAPLSGRQESVSPLPMSVAFDPRGQGHGDVQDPGGSGGTEAEPCLVNSNKNQAFRDLVVSHQPNLVVLVETKVQFSVADDALRACGFDSFVVVEVDGRAGGISIGWKRDMVTVSTLVCHSQFLHARVHFKGDFNSYLDQTEKLGGPKFTWERVVGVHPVTVLERLDRGLANPLWRVKFSEVVLTHLPRVKSDHSPLLLRLRADLIPRALRPFRFQAAWLLDDRFGDVSEAEWYVEFGLSWSVPES
ncbi:hypothetical protein Tsubulata_026210 [Turnera subulata]|uniref:DUF4283 domain-containing protein n=1 Tax=Turnera subulata TaxID=218843 RepID=A0A9Q0F8H8_9ROSI|nr:hypothetical protein Tsubulata_026210 [Turnera subulata]